MKQTDQFEQEYQDALNGLRFSHEAKEQMMENLMAEQEEKPAKRRVRWSLRAGLIAACLCLTLLGTAVAAQYLGVRIVDGAGTNMDVWMEGGVVFYPYDSLGDEIKALENTPTHKIFNSWQAAEDFIGVDLMNNPVLDASPTRGSKPIRIRRTIGGRTVIQGGRVLVSITEELENIRVIGGFWRKNHSVFVTGQIYTDRAEDCSDWHERFYGLGLPEGTELSWGETYTAPSGLEAQLLVIGGDYQKILAGFSLDGFPFVVEVHAHGDMEKARATLFEVLDGFVLE